MLYALNNKGIRISANDANRKSKYYCPCCNEELILKQGDIYVHHFAHKKYTDCINNKDLSSWQYEWICKFPEDEREYIYECGDYKYYCHVKHKDRIILFIDYKVSYNELNRLSDILMHDDLYLFVVFKIEGYHFHKVRKGYYGAYLYELDSCRLPVPIGPGNIMNTHIFFDGWSSYMAYEIDWCIVKDDKKVSYKKFYAYPYKKEALINQLKRKYAFTRAE